jgi:hypothetical protein
VTPKASVANIPLPPVTRTNAEHSRNGIRVGRRFPRRAIRRCCRNNGTKLYRRLEHGTKLVMAWLFSKIDATKSKKAEVDGGTMRREAANTANAKAMAEIGTASGDGNVFCQVLWDSLLLKGLLEPIAPSAYKPWRLIEGKTIGRPHGKPCMPVAKYIELLYSAPFQALVDGVAGSLVDTLADSLGGQPTTSFTLYSTVPTTSRRNLYTVTFYIYNPKLH